MTSSTRFSTLFAVAVLSAGFAGCATTSLGHKPSVTILEPANGAVVTSPVKVRFAVEGMTVRPAGELAAGTGHNHLLIDQQPVPQGASVPMDAKHLHFGKGQTEAEVVLEPGKYKLTSQFADGAHRSYGPSMTDSVIITVKAAGAK